MPIGSLCLLAIVPLALTGWLEGLARDLHLKPKSISVLILALLLLRATIAPHYGGPLSFVLLATALLFIGFVRGRGRAQWVPVVLGSAVLLLTPLPLTLGGLDPVLLTPLLAAVICGATAQGAGGCLVNVTLATLLAGSIGQPQGASGLSLLTSLDLYQTLAASACVALALWSLRQFLASRLVRIGQLP